MIVRVHAHPRSSRVAITSIDATTLEIWLRAVPADNKANEEITRMLAKHFRVPAGRVTLRSGQSARWKTFEIAGLEHPHPARQG